MPVIVPGFGDPRLGETRSVGRGGQPAGRDSPRNRLHVTVLWGCHNGMGLGQAESRELSCWVFAPDLTGCPVVIQAKG